MTHNDPLVGLEHGFFLYGIILPIDELIFAKIVFLTTNQSIMSINDHRSNPRTFSTNKIDPQDVQPLCAFDLSVTKVTLHVFSSPEVDYSPHGAMWWCFCLQ